jgi:hypothetical protein
MIIAVYLGAESVKMIKIFTVSWNIYIYKNFFIFVEESGSNVSFYNDITPETSCEYI